MSDDVRRVLPDQLRGSGDCGPGCGCLLCEAANEIDRLRAEVERLEDMNVLDVLESGCEKLSRGHNKFHIIDSEQIENAMAGAVWVLENEDDDEDDRVPYLSAADLGIVKCTRCNGVGRLPRRAT